VSATQTIKIFFIVAAFLFLPCHFVLAGDISPVWQLLIGKNSAFNSPYIEIDEDGSLYITREGKLIKISDGGEVLWEYEIPSKYQRQVTGSPKVAGDFVVFTSGYFGGYAYFLNKDTGELVTEHELFDPKLLGKFPYYYSKPALSADSKNLYIHFTYPEYLFGFDTKTGQLTGKKFISESIGGPAYASQVISYADVSYIGTLNGTAYSIYPYGFIDGFGEGDMDLLNFAKDPSPSMIGSLYLLGPAIDYKNRKLYYFDRYGPGNSPAVVILNLGDGTLLGTVSFSPSSLRASSPPILDRFGNIFMMTYDDSALGKDKLFKISSNGEITAVYEFPITTTGNVSVVVDNEGSVYATVDKVYKFSNDLEELFTFDMGSWGEGMAPLLSSDFNYLYTVSKNGILFKIPTSYQDPGCTRDYYCDTTPKHHPVIFVHGLGGKDTDWLTGNKAKMRDLILTSYKKDDPEYPDSWAYAYHYGYDDQGKYNYQGDIRQIAKGLQEDVARLSYESVQAGGDGKVDLVGFSLGGQIIREYFAQMVRDPSKVVDDRPHKIDNAVIIASPNKGSWAYSQKDKLPWPLATLLTNEINYYMEEKTDNGQPVNINCIALGQLKPDSSFMSRVSSRYATDVDYSLLYGDISGTTKQDFFGVQVGGKLSVGDTLISADSASDIPNIANEKKYTFDSDLDMKLKINIGTKSIASEIEIPTPEDYIRWRHKDLIEQPEIHNKVLEILTE